MDITMLKKVPLFDTLTDGELSEVLRLAKEEEHKSGDKIFAEGDAGDKLYINW